MASPAIPARRRSADRTPPAVAPARTPRDASRPRVPFYSGDPSQWLALNPVEQAEVLVAAYQERLLPEIARIERLLTRLAVEYGLEHCRLEELAIAFFDAAREIYNHLHRLKSAVAAPPKDLFLVDNAIGNSAAVDLIARFSALALDCAAEKQTSPCFTRLVDVLEQCQGELAALVDLEIALSR